MRRLTVRLDEPTDAALQRNAAPGDEAAYVRAAVTEKAARDEQRDHLDEIRRRLERIERKLGLNQPEVGP